MTDMMLGCPAGFIGAPPSNSSGPGGLLHAKDTASAHAQRVCVDVLEDLGYSKHFIRFVRAHREEYETAYLAPTPVSSRAQLERLRREFVNLPPRHVCTCWCSYLRERTTGKVCVICAQRRRHEPHDAALAEIGRTSPVHPPLPLVIMLDLEAGYAA